MTTVKKCISPPQQVCSFRKELAQHASSANCQFTGKCLFQEANLYITFDAQAKAHDDVTLRLAQIKNKLVELGENLQENKPEVDEGTDLDEYIDEEACGFCEGSIEGEPLRISSEFFECRDDVVNPTFRDFVFCSDGCIRDAMNRSLKL